MEREDAVNKSARPRIRRCNKFRVHLPRMEPTIGSIHGLCEGGELELNPTP
jgi:hypothetical protein